MPPRSSFVTRRQTAAVGSSSAAAAKAGEGWSGGKGDTSKLTTRVRNTDAFDVVQYSNATVNQLLNNENVKDQADGVRVLRSWSASGLSYQTVDLKFTKMTDFVWPFKMAHPVNVSLDNRPSIYTYMWNTPGYDQGWNALQVYPSSRTGWTIGWGYGTGAASWGETLLGDLLLPQERTDGLPYAEAYVRPRISSDSSDFARLPDEGAAEQTVSRAVSNYAAKTSWGVTGNINGSYAEGNIQVQAFAQVGSTMYVGGNFTGVKQGENGAEKSSRGLAAFDVNTGDWTGQASTSMRRSRPSSRCPTAASSWPATSPASTARPTSAPSSSTRPPARSTPRGI